MFLLVIPEKLENMGIFHLPMGIIFDSTSDRYYVVCSQLKHILIIFVSFLYLYYYFHNYIKYSLCQIWDTLNFQISRSLL